LRYLQVLRRASANDATATLAEALATERAATAAEMAATSIILAELSEASAASADDSAVDALVGWLPRARKSQADARERRRLAEATTTRVRAELAAARAAEATVSALIDARVAQERADTERRTQAALIERISRGTVGENQS
jgi:hypothetical protein